MQNGKHGIQLHPDIIQLFIILFADDVALLSFSVKGLQHQLDLLKRNAEVLDLSVNLDKSSVMIFRNGGKEMEASKEKWFFNDNKLKVVNAYKYLGVWFINRFSFTLTINKQTAKAKHGMVEIFKTLWKVGDVNKTIFFKL